MAHYAALVFVRCKPLFLPVSLVLLAACPSRPKLPEKPAPAKPTRVTKAPSAAPLAPWQKGGPLPAGQVYVMNEGQGKAMSESEARAKGFTVVDLSDNWVPFILSEQDADGQEPKPQPYRQTYLDLANDRVDPDVLYLRGGGPTKTVPSKPQGLPAAQRRAFEDERKKSRAKGLKRLLSKPADNFLEPFGIPPTLSVLQKRFEWDAKQAECFAHVDSGAFLAFSGSVSYQSMDESKRDYQLVLGDTRWVEQRLEKQQEEAAGKVAEAAALGQSDLDVLSADPKHAPRVKRYRNGIARVAAIKATQQRLRCEGLLPLTSKITPGVFDLPTHEALAAFEQKNDVFSWGILGDETLVALQRTPAQLQFETFKRVLAERVVDSASILEDESVLGLGKSSQYKDENGIEHAVPNLVAEYQSALLAALGVRNGQDVPRLFGKLSPQALATLKVAFAAPQKPPYYTAEMQLEVQIDRGDVWYDFPFDDDGEQRPQPRSRFPHLTMFVRWNNQRIALAHWRTTIGSWRSERHPDGNVYYKYKNSDVGPRVWKNIVVSPVWLPPDGTPPKDMLTRKKFDPAGKPETVVNTDVVGPGFQSAYGLVLAIHQQPSGFDNQIRTHGSVDYTSIARRYSHGCHRLVNNRAVRMFGFVLAHSAYTRLGDQKVAFRRQFAFENSVYEYSVSSRGYQFELKNPIKVEVLEGHILGKLDKPIDSFVRKVSPAGDRGDEADSNLVLPEGAGGPSPPLEAEAIGTTGAKPPPKVINPGQARALSGLPAKQAKPAKKPAANRH